MTCAIPGLMVKYRRFLDSISLGGSNGLFGNHAEKAVPPRHPHFPTLYRDVGRRRSPMAEEWRTYGEFVRWKDCKEKYGPISTMAFWIATSLVALAAILAYAWRTPLVDVDSVIFFDKCVVIVVIAVILLSIAAVDIRNYFWRNIIGYNLWIFYDEDPDHNEFRNLVGQVCPRSRMPDKGNLLVVPIGGWFNRPRIVFERRGGYAFTGSEKPYWHLTDFRWRDHQELPGSQAIIRTGHGEKITIDAGEFIRLLEYLWKYKGGAWYPPAMPVGMALKDLLYDRFRLADDKAILLNIVRDAIDAIAASKRFGKSKEGARIREKLVSDLIDFLPEDHPLRERLIATNQPAA